MSEQFKKHATLAIVMVEVDAQKEETLRELWPSLSLSFAQILADRVGRDGLRIAASIGQDAPVRLV